MGRVYGNAALNAFFFIGSLSSPVFTISFPILSSAGIPVHRKYPVSCHRNRLISYPAFCLISVQVILIQSVLPLVRLPLSCNSILLSPDPSDASMDHPCIPGQNECFHCAQVLRAHEHTPSAYMHSGNSCHAGKYIL